MEATRSEHGSKSTDSKQRLSVSIAKRLIPMDILTDAKAVTGEAMLSQR